MRALALDLGSQRIGVALSDSGGALAVPFETVQRSGDWDRDHRAIAELVAEADADVVVVGLPLSLDGSVGRAAKRTQHEIRHMARNLTVPIETYDERLSTVSAQRSMQEAGIPGRRRRQVVDQLAAAVILQAWLDNRRDATDVHTDDTAPRTRAVPGEDPT